MPELPEVETIRLGLEKYIVGKTIIGVEVRLKKMLSADPMDIIGAEVTQVRRFGKGLVIDLDNDYSIAIHIKLTGQLIYRGPEIPQNVHLSPKVGKDLPNKWTHVIFKLKNKNEKLKTTNKNLKFKNAEDAHLYYNDLRQFGWIKIIKTSELKTLPFFKDLGPEPPIIKNNFYKTLTLDLFKQILSKSSLAIKLLLMDQKRIGGIGNIYANDALYDSKIDPRKSAKRINPDKVEKLYNSILNVLKKGLESGGASELSFVNVLGEDGGYQKHFLVYAQDKKPCPRCKTIIKKIKLSGRGTYFCPKCQK